MEDSIESDLLLHVIDASDPFINERIEVVNHILNEIGAKQKRILVFNKIDLLDKIQLAEIKKHFPEKGNVRVSVKEGTNLEDIKTAIIENL